jgi:hypothetical protein
MFKNLYALANKHGSKSNTNFFVRRLNLMLQPVLTDNTRVLASQETIEQNITYSTIDSDQRVHHFFWKNAVFISKNSLYKN